MRSALRTINRALLTATLVATALVVGGVAPAHAYTCGYNDTSADIRHSELRLSFRFEEACSDGRSRFTGTIYDTLCDGREAIGVMKVYDSPSDQFYLWTNTARAQNGCGSQATFTFSGPSPGASGWQLRINMAACSAHGLNCSTNYNHYYYG
jgi:hypothetical protein